MRLETTYLNERLELFDGVYGDNEAAALRSVSRAYNRHLGPVLALNVHRPETTDLGLYSASCRHSPLAALMPDVESRPMAGQSPLVPAGGKGATLVQAVTGALGEAAERLLAILHYQHVLPELVFASYDELQRLGVEAIHPDRLPLFAPEQYAVPSFRWRPFTPQSRVRWIRGTRMLTGEPVLVPAQLVLLWYERLPGEMPIGYPTTGGLAFHSDDRRAILHALYEVVERDAINVGWVCRIPPRRIEVDIASFLRDLLGGPRRMSSALVSGVHVFLNTLDGPLPVITVTAFDQSRASLSFLAGGGAWSTKERALTQALFEVGQCKSVLRHLESEPHLEIQAASGREAMRDFLDATVYYGYRENHPRLDWYMSGDAISWDDVPAVTGSNLEAEWLAVCAWLAMDRIDPVVIRLDSACWPGACVLKVLVPELTSAWVPAEPMLGHPRYRTMRRKLGLDSTPLAYDAFNELPLPFP